MCRVKTNETAGKKAAPPPRKDALQLSAIRKALPEEGITCPRGFISLLKYFTLVFVKSLSKSLFYLCVDVSMWLGALAVMYTLVHSDTWKAMSFWSQALTSFVYFNFTGFFMWALFVSDLFANITEFDIFIRSLVTIAGMEHFLSMNG